MTEDETLSWIGSKVRCDLCNFKWVAVYHKDSKKLECKNCGNMSHFEQVG
jgi:primosomal protein N'